MRTVGTGADVIAQGLSGLEPEGAAFEAGRIMLEWLDELTRRRESFAFETTLAGRAYARRIADREPMGHHGRELGTEGEEAEE